MVAQSDEERWKDEAEQLKQDLKKRQKIVRKREVPLQMGRKRVHVQRETSESMKKGAGSSTFDQFLKQQIDIEPLDEKK